jgi:hypothetical protein
MYGSDTETAYGDTEDLRELKDHFSYTLGGLMRTSYSKLAKARSCVQLLDGKGGRVI